MVTSPLVAMVAVLEAQLVPTTPTAPPPHTPINNTNTLYNHHNKGVITKVEMVVVVKTWVKMVAITTMVGPIILMVLHKVSPHPITKNAVMIVFAIPISPFQMTIPMVVHPRQVAAGTDNLADSWVQMPSQAVIMVVKMVVNMDQPLLHHQIKILTTLIILILALTLQVIHPLDPNRVIHHQMLHIQ